MRSAEISEKFSVTLWACLSKRRNIYKTTTCRTFRTPQDKTKKSTHKKKQFIDNFFMWLGAFAPLPSATPYPEGKKKGTCINRYLIVLYRLNRCHGEKVNKIKGF